MADHVGSKVTYFLVGLGVGALVGILFAPKSGEETRELLSKKADEGRDYAQRKARERIDRAQQGGCGTQEGFDFSGRGSWTRRLSARSGEVLSFCRRRVRYFHAIVRSSVAAVMEPIHQGLGCVWRRGLQFSFVLRPPRSFCRRRSWSPCFFRCGASRNAWRSSPQTLSRALARF